LKRVALFKPRRAINLTVALVGAAWIAWCLYWPFWARQQDTREALKEAEASYRVCLEQRALTRADCTRDRAAYEQLWRELIAPHYENVYQSFAGGNPRQTLALMLTLCLAPPLMLFAASRMLLALRPRSNVPSGASRQHNTPVER